ncbi:uncharacterized protein LOC132933163, partial [Metopolophium dirhodum]|uniref:uncharacterized protein LOC132933163 n=1 Tax=Metopolophium dirhodum TaxID=44670 RepID=UPI00298FD6A1
MGVVTSSRDGGDTAHNAISGALHAYRFWFATCKEKWRNLRTVFLRHLRKKTPSGSQADFSKKYYLYDAMQFLMLFIKSGRQQKGNLTSPQLETEMSLMSDVNIFDDVTEDEFPNSNHTVNSEPVLDQSTSQPTQPIHNKMLNNIGHQKSNKIKTTNEIDVDRCFIDYFNNKKHKPNDSADENFLLSLLPDVQQMSQTQKRRFKREVLAVIDSILEEPTASTPSTSDTGNTYSSETDNSTLPNHTVDSYKDNEFD